MAVQYKLVAEEIGRNIAARRYGDTLPPLRELSEQFQVSLHTVQRALRLLSQRSLVAADSTRGIRIIQRPQSKIIGVLCNFRKGNSNDPVVQSLRKQIEADGYEAIFLDVPEKVCNEPDGAFWRYGWADGYISLYGTSDTNIDLCLKSFNLPVITANHAARKAELPCVDFDHTMLLKQLATGLYERGYRKIALSFTICSKLISDEVNAAFAEFCQQHQLELPRHWVTSAAAEDIKIQREVRIAQQFEQILGDKDQRPEAVICFHHGLKFAAALAAQYDLALGQDLVIAGTGRNDVAGNGVLPVELSYCDLAEGLWSQLKKQINDPQKKYGTTLLPPPEIDWSRLAAKTN